MSFPISVLTLKFLIFHASCWDRLKKEPRITTVSQQFSTLNPNSSLWHLWLLNLNPIWHHPYFDADLPQHFLCHVPVQLQILCLHTAAFQMHWTSLLQTARKWLGSLSTAFFLFHCIRQINKTSLHQFSTSLKISCTVFFFFWRGAKKKTKHPSPMHW